MPRADLDPSYDSHLLQHEDFLISRSGTCGVPAVFDISEGGEKVIPGAFLIRLRLNEELDPHFLRAYFNSEPGRKLTGSLAQGGVQKNIRGSSLLNSTVPFPSLSEQRLLLRYLRTFEEATRSSERELASVSTLGSTFSSELLGGN